MKKLEDLVRPHILQLKPYSSARDEFSGTDGILLDANENAFGSTTQENYNRYPDPYQRRLKEKIADIKKVAPEQIFLGNGSDEPIDLIIRLFCSPRIDNVVVMPPTYDMYSVSATINDTEVRKVTLTKEYDIDINNVFNTVDEYTKLIFICSPNNPTGNSLNNDSIKRIIQHFEGMVVLDEAYIDFSVNKSLIRYLGESENLIVLQTFSKAWGLAGLRLGLAFGSPYVIKLLNKIKFPYNINQATQQLVEKALESENIKDEMVKKIIDQRKFLERELRSLDIVEKIYPSDANFLLVRFKDAVKVHQFLLENNVIVRNRSKLVLCEQALRITAGTSEENKALLSYLKKFEQ